MKHWVGALILVALSGCGTIKTLQDEEGVGDELARWQTNCHSVPRVYSGAAYQFCNLDSPPRARAHWAAPPVALDMLLSAVADTLVLPYTAYQQAQRGDIQVRRRNY